VIAAIAVVVLLGGVAAYYFGYHMNPSVIYSQSLKNTGKGYDKLINYADQQSNAHYKGYTASGSYKVNSKSFTTDGQIAFRGDDANSQLTFDVGTGTGRVKADVRTIKSTGTSPDIYVKATGLKGIPGLATDPTMAAQIGKLDDSWIVIDHTLIDNLQKAAMAQGGGSIDDSKLPTSDQVLNASRAYGKVNQEYLFTTKKDKAVTRVVKKYGIEKVGGHKAYHYKVELVKANIKKYDKAQCDALKASQLGSWLKKNKYQVCTDDDKSANDTDSSNTFDVWADVNQRLIYKVRFADTKNPSTNYADLGLDYKGGDNYPFFISGQTKSGNDTTSGSLVASINSKSNQVNFKFNLKSSGADGMTATGNLVLVPSNSPIKVDKPTGAKPLETVLQELGLGDIFNAYTQPTATPVPDGLPTTGDSLLRQRLVQ